MSPTTSKRGSPRDVLDWIDWLMHCEWVNTICDSPSTAVAVFNAFPRSPGAERGRALDVPTDERALGV